MSREAELLQVFTGPPVTHLHAESRVDKVDDISELNLDVRQAPRVEVPSQDVVLLLGQLALPLPLCFYGFLLGILVLAAHPAVD